MAKAPFDDTVYDLPKKIVKSQSGTSLQLPREGKFWLLASVVMYITGLFKGINLLVLFAYLMMGLWVVNWRFVSNAARGVVGRRIPANPIYAGVSTELVVEILCDNARPRRGLTISDQGAEHLHEWLILQLIQNRPAHLRRWQIFHKRGRYAVDPLYALSQFPFGLCSRSVQISDAEEWIVIPRLGTINRDRLKHWLARKTRGDGRMRRHMLQPALQEADIHGLRQFRTGDSPRWIHWRSSARRNQLLVREFEDSTSPTLVVVVEPWLPSGSTAGEQNELEALICLAASVCKEWCRDSTARLTLVIMRRSPLILGPGSNPEFVRQALEALAVEEGHPDEAAESWLPLLPAAARCAPLLILTSRQASNLPDTVDFHTGRAAAVVTMNEVHPWYEPPRLSS